MGRLPATRHDRLIQGACPLTPAKVRDSFNQIVTVGQKLDDGWTRRPADHAVSTDVTHQY
jgi:hypothetical protein